MAVSAKWYGVPIKYQYNGTAVVDYDTDTIKVALHTSTYAPAQDTDDYFADATNEISGTNYTAGGVTLTNKAVDYTAGTNIFYLDADDAQWASASFTARIATHYKSTGNSATSPLISYIDFGGDETVASGTFTIQFAAPASGGIASITLS